MFKITLSKRFTIPFEGRFALVLKSFSATEKHVFFAAIGVLVGTAIILGIAVNRAFVVKVPANSGTFTEGVINTPAHINPLLAMGEIGSEADRDLVALIYSGLLRTDGNGGYIPDLAQSYEVSQDGLVYTFTLKPSLIWHDGKKISADDIIFTVKTAQDSRIKSSKRASWDGIGVEKIDDLTIRFVLNKPYTPFLENTTMGILPAHIWRTIDFNRFDTNKYNREPIGSGPYKLASIKTTTKDGDKIPISYTLKAFDNFALGRPHINTIKLLFYHSENDLIAALENNEVEAINSITPERAYILAQKGYLVVHTPLPRILAVFFNQNESPVLADIAVRKALSLATDKQALVNTALAGYGVVIDGAIPLGVLSEGTTLPSEPRAKRIANARTTLTKGGWNFDEATHTWTKKVKKEIITLRIELATSDASELKIVVHELKTSWEELGVKVDVKIFAIGDLKETIMRPRKFDALFFGQVIGRDGDPYPFWHSSQRLDPGLNIVGYTNAHADKLLEQARTETDRSKRARAYQAFQDELNKDIPAIFTYTPEFLYIAPKNVHRPDLRTVTLPSERFTNVYEWYIHTDDVWKIFVQEQ